MGLDLLLTQVRSCSLCQQHLPLGPRPVVQASAQASVLIAGQAPGRKVHASGKPFDDASGERLRTWLGVKPETFYDATKFAILPMGFCYPGSGKGGDLPPRPECAPRWREPLLAQLPNIKLTLAIGRYAIDWHLPEHHARVTDAVQSWQTHWPNLIALPHPSPRNNRWLAKNDWFERQLVPKIQARVASLLNENNELSLFSLD
ncbi:IclR family transcriptional regulator [Aliidiomarina minuta]|uniref:IclR family transcriptional regulator n=1 Tax=Aliidiomarina minuta TaxID=880057 RepID=A0A432W773_9GAMM|nr:uracil-DNA glycosylase family protein [Aliidiomarina minuta]RUO25930.1 IclR family transcriptional regulator [Aliidiomarina minuta]